MFRRLESGLPQDPRFPADLRSLGFFVNDQQQIRKIHKPEQEFVYRITNDERTNEVHKEAFHIAVRKEVRSRLKDLGIGRLYLPGMTSKKPKAPHVPIAMTPMKELRTRKRVVIVIGDEFQDLGIFAWRMLAHEAGIEAGSVIALVKELTKGTKPDVHSAPSEGTTDASPAENNHDSNQEAPPTPGIIVLNPGQLLYSYSQNDSMSRNTWNARNKPSAVHRLISVNEKNYVEGNKTAEEHVAFVFNNVIANAQYVRPDAELYIIGMQDRGDLVLQYLNGNWEKFEKQVKAIALMEPRHFANSITDPGLKTFLEDRGKAWSLSNAPAGTPLKSPNVVADMAALENGASTNNGVMADLRSKSTLANDLDAQKSSDPANGCEGPSSSGSLSALSGIAASVAGIPLKDDMTLKRISDGVNTIYAPIDVAPVSDRDDGLQRVTTQIDESEHKHGERVEQHETTMPTTAGWSTDNDIAAADVLDNATVTQPTFSAGDLIYPECIFPTHYKAVIDFFEAVARAPDSYKNAPILETELYRGDENFIEAEEHEPVEIITREDAEAKGLLSASGGNAGADGGHRDIRADSVLQEQSRDATLVQKYAGGEQDAAEEHGAFAVKDEHGDTAFQDEHGGFKGGDEGFEQEKQVRVGGAMVSEGLLKAAGLDDDNNGDEGLVSVNGGKSE